MRSFTDTLATNIDLQFYRDDPPDRQTNIKLVARNDLYDHWAP
jgi:hypothetical protein